MKAAVLDAFGGPEAFRIRDVSRPTPRADEVLVRVRCCGVCHLDLILRSGMRSRVSLPRILGHELAGEVVEVGARVNGFSPGDRVAACNFQACGHCRDCRRGRPSLCRHAAGDVGQARDGGYAEFSSLPASNLVKVPDGMPFEHACLGACVYGPPYKAIRQVGRAGPGDTVVVTGASGGLGLAAIQIARAVGARCIAVTGSHVKADRIRAAGADDVVVSPDGAFGDEVRRLTDGRGADLVVELVGSPTFAGSLRGLAPGGRCAVIGELHGRPVEINLGLLIIKEWELIGVQSASREDLAEILSFMHERAITPVVWKSLPLDDVADAHRALADRDVVGRLLLTP